MNAIKAVAVLAMLAMTAASSAWAQQESEPESGSSMDHGTTSGERGSMMGQGMMGGGGEGAPMMGHRMMGEGGGMMGRGGMHGMGKRGGILAMCGKMTAHVEGRLAFLKAELEITPEQETLWNAYAVAVRDNAKTTTDRCGAMMNQSKDKKGLIERIDTNTQFMQGRIDGLHKIVEALKPLYAALNDEQKKTADQLIKSSTGFM
jgi:hypothetical protein